MVCTKLNFYKKLIYFVKSTKKILLCQKSWQFFKNYCHFDLDPQKYLRIVLYFQQMTHDKKAYKQCEKSNSVKPFCWAVCNFWNLIKRASQPDKKIFLENEFRSFKRNFRFCLFPRLIYEKL